MGQSGTLLPNSCAIPSASAVLPVPGAPVIKRARPAIFFSRIMSHTTPHASQRRFLPDPSAAVSAASPSSFKPKPYTTNEPIARALVLVSHSLVVIPRRSRRSRVEDTTHRIGSKIENRSVDLDRADHSFPPRPPSSRARLTLMCVCAAMRATRQARHLVDLHPIDRLRASPSRALTHPHHTHTHTHTHTPPHTHTDYYLVYARPSEENTHTQRIPTRPTAPPYCATSEPHRADGRVPASDARPRDREAQPSRRLALVVVVAREDDAREGDALHERGTRAMHPCARASPRAVATTTTTTRAARARPR